MNNPYVLEIENLKTSFFTSSGVVPAVDGLSMRLPVGKIVGIVGESGCGKSMTAMSIMGLLKKPGKIVEGRILLEGERIDGLSRRALSRLRGNKMSMIFQDPMTGLNPVLRVGPQVDEALRLHRGMGKLAARDRTLEIFSEVGISDPEKRYLAYPYQLSGGLRQRAMIAMAMICEPKLLIADEPTTALDVTIEAQILRLMHKLCREKGTSILLITHNMGVVASVCDFVYVMYAGQVMEEAETETLFFRTAHPYTKGLLQSIPRMDEKQSRLFTIEGAVPDLRQLPAGCVFSNRCPEAREKCKKEKPPLCSLAGREGHRSRCFFSEMDP